MFWAIIFVLLILVGAGMFLFWKPKALGVVPIVLAVLVMVFASFTTIPTGFTGVLTTFGRVEDTTLEAGINFKAPWQNIILMDNREQINEFTFKAFSSDIQEVNVIGTINYSVNKQTCMTLYKEVGTNYAAVLINPRVYENIKVVFSKYTAENLLTNRDVLAIEALEMMKEDLESYGINVVSIAIKDIDFTDAFTNAVEQKQVAQQEKLRAETIQEQQVMEAEAEAKRKTISAQAEAEVAKVRADADAYAMTTKAEAEAKANAVVAESLTAELIEYEKNQLWNGQLPNTYVGNGEAAMPIIDVMGE